jgi:MOSC domain-containing protein YiiM
MSSRVASLIAKDEADWALAGDQFYVDLDLSRANLPPGTRLILGDATIEVSEQPHTGCRKFRERFGIDALRWANSPEGRELRLRGLNARVIAAGAVRSGDTIAKH